MHLFTPKKLKALPLADARTPIRLCASTQLRVFSYAANGAGAAGLLALVYMGDFTTQTKLIGMAAIACVVLVNALISAFFSHRAEVEIVAFGLHAAARPDVFSLAFDVNDALNPAPGTVKAQRKREPLEIYTQTRGGAVQHGKLCATQFVAPFFTCVRFEIFTDDANKPRRNRFHVMRTQKLLLLPDNIDANAFRQCRVLLRWS